jgi:hypothetical protein
MEKNSSITPLLRLYDLHTGLFPNVIAGISEKDAHNRLGTKANHVAWIAGTLVHWRCNLAKIAGLPLPTELQALAEQFKSIQDDVTYPPLAELNAKWDKITPILRPALEGFTEEQLNAAPPQPMKEMGNATLSEYIGFFNYLESYSIGQIGLWRRLLGYEAMKYPE